jgi:hypothetical protein
VLQDTIVRSLTFEEAASCFLPNLGLLARHSGPHPQRARFFVVFILWRHYRGTNRLEVRNNGRRKSSTTDVRLEQNILIRVPAKVAQDFKIGNFV